MVLIIVKVCAKNEGFNKERILPTHSMFIDFPNYQLLVPNRSGSNVPTAPQMGIYNSFQHMDWSQGVRPRLFRMRNC